MPINFTSNIFSSMNNKYSPINLKSSLTPNGFMLNKQIYPLDINPFDFEVPSRQPFPAKYDTIISFDFNPSYKNKESYFCSHEVKNKETYNSSIKNDIIKPKSSYSFILSENLKNIINARAKGITDYLMNNELYSPWVKHWNLLVKNLKKNRIQLLSIMDDDIGFTINKNELTSIKIHDGEKFNNINIITHILIHELCHLAVTYSGHPDEFFDLLSIMIHAASEMNYFNFKTLPDQIYMVINTPTISKESLKQEIIKGNNLMKHMYQSNSEYLNYLNDYQTFISQI